MLNMVIKRKIQNFIRRIQKLLITLLLFIVYFLCLGITLILMAIFNRKALTGYSKGDNTFWIEAQGYEADIEDSMRQS